MVISRIVRGCGYLEGYGHHPGTATLIAFVVMGGLAGVRAGWRGVLLGLACMAILFVPMYLYGAYERTKDWEDRPQS